MSCGSAATAAPEPRLAICGVRLARDRTGQEQSAQPPAAGPAAVQQPAAADDRDLVEHEQQDGATEGGLAIPAEPAADADGPAKVGKQMG